MENGPHAGVGIRISSDPDATRVERLGKESAKRLLDLPLRLLLATDLAPEDDRVRVVPVERSRFPEFFSDLAPKLTLEVRNQVGTEPALLDVSLAFASLNDFSPRRVAEQIPAVASLLAVRGAVEDFRTGTLDPEAFKNRLLDLGIDRTWIDALVEALTSSEKRAGPSGSRTGASAPSDDPLDRLFGMVDVESGRADMPDPSTESPTGGGFVDALLEAVSGRGAGSRVEKSAVETLLRDLDQAVADQVRAVIEHPDFRALESAWRGLKFLVDHVDSRANVQIEVLPVGRSELSDALYHHVLMPEHAREDERPPLSALLLGFDFDASAADVALLEDLAETGSSLQVPVLASVAPAFYGVASPRGLEQLPPLRQHLDGPAWIAWHKLRNRDDAQWLALALPGVLARDRHEPSRPSDDMAIDERDDLTFGGAYVVGAAMARSHAAIGWPTRIRGTDFGVEGLPLRQDARGAVPLAAVLSEERQADFAEAGFVVIGCRLNRDGAFVAHAPTTHRPQHFDEPEIDEGARASASLPGRLFASRAAHVLLAYQNELAADADLETVRTEVADRFRKLMAHAGHAVADDAVSTEPVGAERRLLAVRLRPPETLLAERISVVVGLQMPVSNE